MSWRENATEIQGEDGYDWICIFLKDYNGDLVELELGIDSQHFYDNIDELLSENSSSTPLPNDHRSSPLQLTPSVLSMISELCSPPTVDETQQEVAQAPSVSFCALLEETHSAAIPGRKTRGSRHAATTPRKHREGILGCIDLTTTTTRVGSTTNKYEKPTTRSSSRKKFNRRLFY